MKHLRKVKNKKRMIIVLLALVFISIAGTTFALFTDVVNLGPQTVTSGTLDLVETVPVALTLPAGLAAITDPIAPGDVFGFAGTVTNAGNLAAKVRVRLEEVDIAGVPLVTPTGDWTITAPALASPLLAAGGTLDLGAAGFGLTYNRTNVNTVQNTPYYFMLRVEAMQDRNTVDTPADWDQVVTTPFTLP